MARVKKSSKFDYNSKFPTIFRKLLDDKKVTQEMIAEKCSVSRQAVANWKDGNTVPDVCSLIEIAKFFNVSADYLLGLAQEPTTDKDLNFICEYTGLSQRAINRLCSFKFYTQQNRLTEIDIIDILLSQCSEKFFKDIVDYLTIEVNRKQLLQITKKGDMFIHNMEHPYITNIAYITPDVLEQTLLNAVNDNFKALKKAINRDNKGGEKNGNDNKKK